jgi:hypothetical protein
VINPDQVSLIKGNGITTPDVLGVDVGDSNVPVTRWLVRTPTKRGILSPRQGLNVLDDDVLGTANHAQTTALDNTTLALTNQGLVRAHSDTEQTSFVAARSVRMARTSIIARAIENPLGNGSCSCIRLVVGAPVILVNSNLARGASTPGHTSGGSGSTFSIGKVETSIPPL